MKRESQTKQIVRFLAQGGKLTSYQAFELFGCTRLAARIYDIKQAGLIIKKKNVFTNGNKTHFSEYYI